MCKYYNVFLLSQTPHRSTPSCPQLVVKGAEGGVCWFALRCEFVMWIVSNWNGNTEVLPSSFLNHHLYLALTTRRPTIMQRWQQRWWLQQIVINLACLLRLFTLLKPYHCFCWRERGRLLCFHRIVLEPDYKEATADVWYMHTAMLFLKGCIVRVNRWWLTEWSTYRRRFVGAGGLGSEER